MNIKLTSNNATETRVLEYLQENASEVLAEKINAAKNARPPAPVMKFVERWFSNRRNVA
jgi:hypothetical protein